MAAVAGDPSSVWQWRGAHPGGGVRYWGEECLRGGRGSTAVENYTTSINHLVPTVFLSLSPSFPLFPSIAITFSPSLSSPCLCILPSFCDPTAPRPDSCPPGFLPFYSSCSPCTGGFMKHCWSPSLAHFTSGFISTVVCLHAFFIDRPLFCCLPGIYPLSRTVLAILEIDLFPWECLDIACCWAGMNLFLKM